MSAAILSENDIRKWILTHVEAFRTIVAECADEYAVLAWAKARPAAFSDLVASKAEGTPKDVHGRKDIDIIEINTKFSSPHPSVNNSTNGKNHSFPNGTLYEAIHPSEVKVAPKRRFMKKHTTVPTLNRTSDSVLSLINRLMCISNPDEVADQILDDILGLISCEEVLLFKAYEHTLSLVASHLGKSPVLGAQAGIAKDAIDTGQVVIINDSPEKVGQVRITCVS